METDLATQVVTWHEDDIPWMLTAPRPGGGSRARDFVDRDRGIAFRISSVTTSPTAEKKPDNEFETADKRGFSPRHRHTFDQVRFYFGGAQVEYGKDEVYGGGDFLYIPGGTFYGPMRRAESWDTGMLDDAERDVEGGGIFYIQFEGKSGIPYYSSNDFVDARERLEKAGRFDRGIYVPDDGTPKDGWEAMLEETTGQPVEYPKSPVKDYVAVRSRYLPWRAVDGLPGVDAKYLGHFTESGPNVMLVRMAPGATLPGGRTPYQQARCLYGGRLMFDDEPGREFPSTSTRYIPPDATFGATHSLETSHMIIVKWAADGSTYLPDASI